MITHGGEKQDPVSRWLHRLVERRVLNKAVVALANKNAWVGFAVLFRHQTDMATHACRAA